MRSHHARNINWDVFKKEGDNVETIIDIFSNLAVPVACLCACFWLWNKERDDHKEELKEITNAVQNNTLVIQKLLDKIQ